MAIGSYKIGKGFLANFKSYLEKIGLSSEKIDKLSNDDISSIFAKADAADGVKDGKATGENFFSILQGEFEEDNLSYEGLESEYLEAWKAMAGDDNILDVEELGKDEEVEETPHTSGGGGTPPTTTETPPETTTTPPEITEVTPESLEGKDSSTLRSERSGVLGQIDTLRSEMETAEKDKTAEVAAKKESYDKLLEEIAKVDQTENENGKTLAALQEDKTAQEAVIEEKKTGIETINGDITKSKENITAIQGKLDSLKEPNKSEFTKQNEEGKTEFDEARYNAALAEYNAQKEEYERQLREEEDNLSSLQQKLTAEETALKTEEEALTKINSDIDALLKVITEANTENSELASQVSEALTAYTTAQQELATIKEPYESKIAILTKNLNTYDTAIQKTEETEKEAKDEWTSDIEDENALSYKNQIDEIYGTDDADNTGEADESQKADDPDKDKALQEILQKAMLDENIPVNERMKLLSYAKGKNEKAVREMLKDDTFFVKAYAALADDENASTEKLLAMQDVYFDIQGDKEISTNFFVDNGELQGSYVEAQVSLVEKAVKNGNLDKVIKNFEKNGISIDSLKETIQASNEYSDAQKEELLSRIDESVGTKRVNSEHTVEKLEYGSLEAEISYPKDLKEGEEVPIFIFFSGSKQNVAYRGQGDNSRYLMYDKDTTPLGNMYEPNTTWNSNQRIINPEYNYNLNSFPGIIIEFNSDKNPSVSDLQSYLDSLETSGVNGTKIKRGKTVIAGASAGTGPSFNAAKGLGSKYVAEYIPISGSMHAEHIEGVDTYAYEYAVYRNGKLAHSTMQKVCEQMGIPNNYSVVESTPTEKVSHHNMIRLMFTGDDDGDGNCDFFQRHFKKYY